MIGQCDTITCCWLELISDVWSTIKMLFHFLWPVLAVYGVLYAIGAGAFLARLRLKQGANGKLIVDHKSLAYKVAHPYLFGKIRKKGIYSEGKLVPHPIVEGKFYRVGMNPDGVQIPKNGSICAFYARMFNMLLFIWPFLLIYFAVTCGVGSLFFAIMFGCYVKPNLSNDGFLEVIDTALPVWPIQIWAPLFLVGFTAWLIGWHWLKFLHIMGRIGWITLCIAPVLVAVAVIFYLGRKTYTDHAKEGTTVNALVEFTTVRKERFCKVIEFE